MRYSIELTDQISAKGYEFLPFAKRILGKINIKK